MYHRPPIFRSHPRKTVARLSAARKEMHKPATQSSVPQQAGAVEIFAADRKGLHGLYSPLLQINEIFQF